jgi:hypothetical protein
MENHEDHLLFLLNLVTLIVFLFIVITSLGQYVMAKKFTGEIFSTNLFKKLSAFFTHLQLDHIVSPASW